MEYVPKHYREPVLMVNSWWLVMVSVVETFQMMVSIMFYFIFFSRDVFDANNLYLNLGYKCYILTNRWQVIYNKLHLQRGVRLTAVFCGCFKSMSLSISAALTVEIHIGFINYLRAKCCTAKVQSHWKCQSVCSSVLYHCGSLFHKHWSSL